MFTGLVEEIGQVTRIDASAQGAHIEIRAKRVLEDVKLGDSISVNGACLTVVRFTGSSFTVDAVPETMRKTTLGMLIPGHPVNLERALRLGDRLGGHLVSGHVDGLGSVVQTTGEGLATVLTIGTDTDILRYVADKGSVCVDGVSLTVMKADDKTFMVSVIPLTGAETTLLTKRVGDKVNLECDVLAKYVHRLLSFDGGQMEDKSSQSASRITMEMLQENGFV
jgi:riboflavin synthase